MTRTATEWLERVKLLLQLRKEVRDDMQEVDTSRKRDDLYESRYKLLDEEYDRLSRELDDINQEAQDAAQNLQKTTFEEEFQKIQPQLVLAAKLEPNTDDLVNKKQAFATAYKTVKQEAGKGEYKEVNKQHLPLLKSTLVDFLAGTKKQRDEQSAFDQKWSGLTNDYSEAVKLPPYCKEAKTTLKAMKETFLMVSGKYAKKDFSDVQDDLDTLRERIDAVLDQQKLHKVMTDKLSNDWGLLKDRHREATQLPPVTPEIKKLQSSVTDKYFIVTKNKEIDPQKSLDTLVELEKLVDQLLFRPEIQGYATFNEEYNKLWPRVLEARGMSAATGAIASSITAMEKTVEDVALLEKSNNYVEAQKMLAVLDLEIDVVLLHPDFDKFNRLCNDYDTVVYRYQDASAMGLVTYGTMPAKVNTMNDAYNKLDVAFQARELDSAFGLIDPLDKAVDEVLQVKAHCDQVMKNVLQEKDEVIEDFKKAYGMPAIIAPTEHQTMTNTAREFNAYCKGYDFIRASGSLKQLKIETTNLLQNENAVAYLKYDNFWETRIKAKYESAIEIKPVSPEIKYHLDLLNDEKTKLDDLCNRGEYQAAILALKTLYTAITAVEDAANRHDSTAIAEVDSACQEVTDLINNGTLVLCTNDEKVKLLEKLRSASGGMTPEARTAQRTIYLSLSLSDDFLEDDKQRRREMVQDLFNEEGMREKLNNAKEHWQELPVEEKTELMQKVLKSQSKKLYGGDPPPFNQIDEDWDNGKIRQGSYRPTTNTIQINTHEMAPFNRDFEATLATLLHENSHCYQYKLVDDLKNGRLDPSDKRYQQALLFEANTQDQGYVRGGEDFETYEKQPTEEHAHLNGPASARAILKELG